MNINITQDLFWNILHDRVRISNYEFKYLKRHLRLFEENQGVVFYSESLINVIDDSWVLILISDVIMVYGNNWNESQLNEIKQSVNLSSFKKYRMTGDAKLVNAIIKNNDIESHKILKERLFYKTNHISTVEPLDNAQIGPPNKNDYPQLAMMFQQYYHEEYNGENDKSLLEMESEVTKHVEGKAIFVLKNNAQELISFCTILNPDIGILFTNSKYRKLGYGKMILSYCSKKLLEKTPEIFLMTDSKKTASNATCKSIGFQIYFDYIDLMIYNTQTSNYNRND